MALSLRDEKTANKQTQARDADYGLCPREKKFQHCRAPKTGISKQNTPSR